MREAAPRFEAAGAKLVVVSGKSAAMAKTLQAQMPFPLLLDPEHTLRRDLGIGQLSLGAVFGVRSLVNYGKALGGARNLAVRPSDATQTPAVVIFDADQNVTWQHVGTALGDYPTIDTVVAHIPPIH